MGPTMARLEKPPQPRERLRLEVLVREATALAKEFGHDRPSATLVASLALVAVIFGKNELIVLGFALIFMLVLPLLRHFRLLD
jgi:hypothetical protein